MTDKQEQEDNILTTIGLHLGEESAISVSRLTKRANFYTPNRNNPISEKKVREIVRRLIVERGELIGSTTGHGYINHHPGYYMITDESEVKKVVKSLKNRAVKILQRGAKIERVGLPQFIGQLKLELEHGTES